MRVHHIKIVTLDLQSAIKNLHLCGFSLYGMLQILNADGSKGSLDTYVMIQNSIFLTVTEDINCLADAITDVAVEVGNVIEICDRVRAYGGEVLVGPVLMDSKNTVICSDYSSKSFHIACRCGSVHKNCIEYAVIKSPVGNLRHTILNLNFYDGLFLPGFSQGIYSATSQDYIKYQVSPQGSCIQNIDHVAFAVEIGASLKYMDWYANCLGFQRFIVNRQETPMGLIIYSEGHHGMRLFALQEHLCSELALRLGAVENEVHESDVKLVFGESLAVAVPDQIQMFMSANRGEGVQHIAFSSQSLAKDVAQWMNNGVKFMKPPVHYYREIQATLEKIEKDHASEVMENHILVDLEVDAVTGREGYLYQVFTAPVMNSQTFFFELIHRDHATGFGAGNISALWRAYDAYLKDQGLHTT